MECTYKNEQNNFQRIVNAINDKHRKLNNEWDQALGYASGELKRRADPLRTVDLGNYDRQLIPKILCISLPTYMQQLLNTTTLAFFNRRILEDSSIRGWSRILGIAFYSTGTT